MNEQRYQVLQLNRADGTTVYLVADTQKMFNYPGMAAAECARLNDEHRKEQQ